MISILIPTYNYNIYPLVKELHRQGERLDIIFEIISFDDCSTDYELENEKINLLNNAKFGKLPSNIGRSAIRNRLAKEANYETLIFLDADVEIISDNFISNYLKCLNDDTEIIYGGILYQKEKPPAGQLLRWRYGIKREALLVKKRQIQPYLRFLTLNFLISKDVFSIIQFNEEIPNSRHEDTLFALDAKKANINIQHIDNPVLHLGIESSQIFLRKSLESVKALKTFIDNGLINAKETSLSHKAEIIHNYHLSALVVFFYKVFRKTLEKNFLSKSPSLLYFDIYRLGYYLHLKKLSA